MNASPTARSADEPKLHVLLVGESWVTHATHLKGFDAFHTTDYVEGATRFISDLRGLGHEVSYLPAHEVPTRFPTDVEALEAYDVVIVSDVGSNTFLLAPETFTRSEVAVNRLEVVAAYVAGGGALLMVGGYMSFAGIDGRARYGSSPLAGVLPVDMLDHDDRVELPEGFVAEIVSPDHEALAGVGEDWPRLLGYNRLRARADTVVLAARGSDPILAVGSYGEGRTAAFASDLAPHWAPPEFVEWPGYVRLWNALLGWLARSDESPASSDRVEAAQASQRHAIRVSGSRASG